MLDCILFPYLIGHFYCGVINSILFKITLANVADLIELGEVLFFHIKSRQKKFSFLTQIKFYVLFSWHNYVQIFFIEKNNNFVTYFLSVSTFLLFVNQNVVITNKQILFQNLIYPR